MKMMDQCVMAIVVAGLMIGTSSCAQDDTTRNTGTSTSNIYNPWSRSASGQQSAAPLTYDKEQLKQSARDLGKLASDFKTFYDELKTAVQDSGITEVWNDAGTGFGSYDIQSGAGSMTVRVDLPGVDRQSLAVKLKDQEVLEIGGSRKKGAADKVVKGGRYGGTFKKSIELPQRALAEGLKASYEDGVLTVVMPMEEPVSGDVINIPVT